MTRLAPSPNRPYSKSGAMVVYLHARRRNGAAAYAPANAAATNSQLPTLSVAPPVRPRPLVQPRASFAPTPIAAPPANASRSAASARDRRTVLGRPAHAPRKKSRREPADHDANDLEHQPVPQWVRRAGVQVPGVERVVRRVLRRRGRDRGRDDARERARRAEPAPHEHERQEQDDPDPDARDVRARVRRHWGQSRRESIERTRSLSSRRGRTLRRASE